MPLTTGSRLGPYEIVALLGVGGMGEVYRATDTSLKRQVAIKVLPETVAADPERLARFQREAEVLAALNHPNIAHIYGLERLRPSRAESGSLALVMELVEGPTLADRIAQGAIPLADALPIARQIAEALEGAHEQGIIHRDLKPANIKVRDDGTVKVLDFGLAKAMDPGGTSSASASMSPTLSMHATQAGVILGTAAYMSPEQARGKPVDRRADVWAFGCVLYEMLTGRRAFDGEDVTVTLARVVEREPDFDSLPPSVPARVCQTLRLCLRKDPKQRVGDIRDVRLALEGAFETATLQVAAPAAESSQAGTPRRVRALLVASVLGTAFVATLATWSLTRPSPADPSPAVRFFVSPPDGWTVTLNQITGATVIPAPLVVSPDGRRVAFLANAATVRSRLWVRALDTLAAQELPGTDGANSPFWSPDSRFLAFYTDGKLKTIDVSGGPPVTLCDSPDWRGGAWSREGVILFSPGPTSALQKVSASGGVPTAAMVLEKGEAGHARPAFLPDGRHFLYYAFGADTVSVASLDSHERTLVIKNPGSVNVRYAQDHLLFLRETTLMAQPFDVRGLALTGEPVPVAEQIATTGTPPNALFSVSDTGVLVYQTGMATLAGQQLAWFDRTGRMIGTVEQPGQYNTVALSPDGTRVAVSRTAPQAPGRSPQAAGGATQTAGGGNLTNMDLWVHEFSRSTSTRLTFDPAQDWMAAWSPDGSRIAWSSLRDGVSNLYQKASNSAGNEDALLKSAEAKYAYDWSYDGRFLLYANVAPAPKGYDLWVLPMTGDDRKPRPYLQTDFQESQARFSPDSRFVVFTSNASGTTEVYVRPFPESLGGLWKVSQGGGAQPRWRRDGKELFYISADSKLMAVEVTTTPAFKASVPKALFTAPIWGGGTGATNVTRYDVTADGQKFLINTAPGSASSGSATPPAPTPITVVLNWTAGIRK